MTEHRPPQPHPLSQLRGEFVWEGKYDADGRRQEPRLPLVPPVADVLEAGPAAMGVRAPGRARENLLLSGDNRLALAALLPEYRGRVQLIYIDPPFDTGAEFGMRVPVGAGNGHRSGRRGAGADGKIELVAYRDCWNENGGYLQMMYERLVPMRELLRDTGILCLHCDWRSSATLRLLLDEVFGAERFLNEIVWHYYNKYSAGTRHLPRAHDTILMYARGAQPALQPPRLPRETPTRQLVRENVDGVLRNARDAHGRLRYREVHDRKADDVWRIPQLQPASREWSGYATQKHHELLRRIIALGSREGDLVADFFCGSGTLLSVAEQMRRRWIGCDLGSLAMHTTRKRLLQARLDKGEPEAPGTFAIVSLAAAARSEWFAREFGKDGAACRRHVLAAFGATPDGAAANGHGALHGQLGKAGCAMPEVEGLCTAEHVRAAAQEAQAAGLRRIYLLAWGYDARFWSELELNAHPEAPELVPIIVPDALVTPAGNAPPVFRPLPRVDVRVLPVPSKQGGFSRFNLQLRSHTTGPSLPAWSNQWKEPPQQDEDPLALVEGWSVDPSWKPGGAFRHTWWSFRTHHDRSLVDRSDALPRNGGRPCILVSDVWGQATLHTPTAPAGRGHSR